MSIYDTVVNCDDLPGLENQGHFRSILSVFEATVKESSFSYN